MAHTRTAAETISEEESAPNAGVKAAPICAAYCSRSNVPSRSGSGVAANF